MTKRWMSAAFVVLMASPLCAGIYEVDLVHSGVTFRIPHMVISKVAGRFEKFSGTVEYEKGNPKAWKVDVAIDASSIDTRIEERDKHLRSADFLDVEKFPQITFKSARVTRVKGKKAVILGDLTIHGVTKPVALDVEIGGVVKDPWGNERFGATAVTKINRKDFGLMWNKVLETGGLLVGETVEITIEVEGIAKKG